MNTEQLKNFLVLADVLNFHKATEQIYIAQPALSRQIQNLEAELGAELFDRSKKQIRMTAAGDFFKGEARRILDQLGQAKNRTGQIHRGEAGEIRIGHVSSAMQSILPPFLKRIIHTCPDLKIGLLENTNRLIFSKIQNRELDFGILPNAITPENFDEELLYREHFVVVIPKSFVIDTPFQGLKQFADCDWILPATEDGHGYNDILYRLFQKNGFTPKVIFESPNASTNLRLVSEGLGVTIIGKSAMRGINLGIQHVEIEDSSTMVEMRLVWLKERAKELDTYLKMFLRLFEAVRNQDL